MKERKRGHIVNITSMNERSARGGMAVYSGTKAFWAGEGGKYLEDFKQIPGASECLRKELVGTGVKVTNILPGVCNTPAFTKGAATIMEAKDVEEVGRRLIQPEDVGLLV